MAEPDKKIEQYFVFPPEEDDILIPRVGLIEINYVDGSVKGKGQGIRLPQLQGSLEGIHRKSVRSIHIETDKNIRYYTNVGSSKNLIRVRGGDIWETELQPFQKLFIKILEVNTTLLVISSTSLVGMKPLMGRVPTAIDSGQKNVSAAGTAERLVTASTPIRSVVVTAKRTNTGNIFIGGSDVDSTGDIIAPGSNRSVPIDNLNKVFIDSAVSGEGVSFSWVR